MADKSLAAPASQEPSSGKAPRSWVPRACDRCRKRKARCDQQVPCRNCAEAGVTCTHDAPVLKRGPRPKPRNRDVESRLRNLESLLASISSGSASAASVSLSRRELDQIRVAAHIAPASDTSPPSDMGDVKPNVNATPAPDATMGTPGSVNNAPTPVNGMATTANPTLSNYVPPMSFDSFGVPTPGQGMADQQMMSGVNATLQPSMYDPSVVGAVSPTATKSGGITSNTKGQDLLYRDSEGQTKWLGPSSGMPLLERLKVNGHQWNSPLDDGNVTDQWMSLSSAIGVDVEGTNALETITPQDPTSALSPSSSHDEYIWERVTNVIPSDLVDNLVRSYFTISHLLWPILHAPTFMQHYVDPEYRKNPSFVALVLSICALSSRYTPDQRLRVTNAKGTTLAIEVVSLAKDIIAQTASERSDLAIVQALFNFSVVQEGIARTNQVWSFLSQAVSVAMDMGLHRRKDEYNFTAVDLEEQKRTLWALYCQTVQASCTYGRPLMLRLRDIELDEPMPVDDVYISAERGIGTQPADRPSVMAGFVAGIRLHMILERTVRRVNRIALQTDETNMNFIDLVSATGPRKYRIEDELELLSHVTDGLVGDWSFSPTTVADSDSVRFFQRTRVFTLQQFIRLLSARHRLTEIMGSEVGTLGGTAEEQAVLQQITQSALGIIGTYSIIDGQGRLDFFGAHAISQLTQAGAGLIGVVLHVRSNAIAGSDNVLQIALQGLCASILVLRKLGTRRPAGNRSAELLIEFSRACRISIPGLPESEPSPSSNGPVDVPMLRALPRRSNSIKGGSLKPGGMSQAQFDEWLGIALQGTGDWMGPDGVMPPGQEGFAM